MALKKGKGTTRSSPVKSTGVKKIPIEKQPAGANITPEIKEKYKFYVGRLYKRKETGGMYQLNAFSQDFDITTQWVIVFTNVLNSCIYSMKAEKFLKEFELVEIKSKDK